MPSNYPWVERFAVDEEDLDLLTGLLLENETPLTTLDLAQTLVEQRLARETELLKARYQNLRPYNPSQHYEVDQRLVFPALNNAVGTVTATREGNNPSDGAFTVLQVQFEDEAGTPVGAPRDFAADLLQPHTLNKTDADSVVSMPGAPTASAADILAASRNTIVPTLQQALTASDELVSVAGKWFPRSLMLDVDEGNLNLAEAILDMNNGGPLTADEILDQVGDIASAPRSLQTFSLNSALNQDNRFDEVGPVNQVLWYLRRVEPPEVLTTSAFLQYTPIEYDADLLTPEMEALEAEIDDEWSDLDSDITGDRARITLNYPHRRAGTLPLNSQMRQVFPTARRTPRVYVKLVDGQDGEEFIGWVVRQERYIYGLTTFYRKHKPPVGALFTARRSEDGARIIVDFNAHRPRTEYVRLIVPKNGQMSFEEQKRAIGADYDDLMILGADDLAATDALHQVAGKGARKPIQQLVREVVGELGRLTPQGTVHAKTVYNAVNVMRRCPPGPIFAALISSPDYEHFGNQVFKLAAT